MSYLNLNNLINAALVVGAVLSGFGLMVRNAETDEHSEVQDLTGITKVRSESHKPDGVVPSDESKG